MKLRSSLLLKLIIGIAMQGLWAPANACDLPCQIMKRQYEEQERERAERQRKLEEEQEEHEKSQRQSGINAQASARVIATNECGKKVRMLLVYVSHDRQTTTHRWWTLEASRPARFAGYSFGEVPSEQLLRGDDGLPIRHVKSYKILLYAESLPFDGGRWKGNSVRSIDGRDYPFMDAREDLNDDGDFIVNLRC